MAVNILLEPDTLQPVTNEIMVALDSTIKTKNNFQYVIQIYTNGEYSSNIKVPSNPDGYGVFDLHKHIETGLSFDFDPYDNTTFNRATNSYCTYSVVILEEFRDSWDFTYTYATGSNVGYVGLTNPTYFQVGNEILVEQDTPFTYGQYNGRTTITDIRGPGSFFNGTATISNAYFIDTDKASQGGTTTDDGEISLANFDKFQVTSTASFTETKYAFNGVIDFVDFPFWNFANYETNSNKDLFLSSIPRSGYNMKSQNAKMWLNLYSPYESGGASNAYELWVTTNNGTFSLSNSFISPSTTEADKFLRVACGPANITAAGPTVESGSLPVFSDDTTEYTIGIRDVFTGQVTTEYVFGVDSACTPYDEMQLIFQDRFGSFVPFIFNRVHRKYNSVERTTTTENYGSFNSTSNSWSYKSYDRGLKNLSTSVTERYRVTSDWVTTETADFLQELISSPNVYWVDTDRSTDRNVLAINILDTQYERKQTINDQVINVTVEFELASKNRTFKG